MPEAGGRKPVCEFCDGLKDSPNLPQALQFTVWGGLHWLHPQCRFKYEKFMEPRINPLTVEA
jgi:hypothetical protein